MSKKTERGLSRLHFLNIAGLAATASMLGLPSLASERERQEQLHAIGSDEKLFSNAVAEVLEEKTICIEEGRLYGLGTKYELNINGHVIAKNVVKEPNRYIGWPTILKTNRGPLMVAFSGDRDAHICPFGKNQIVTSNDQGKTWSEPVTVNSTPLDDRDSGLIQTKRGTLLLSWFTSLVFENPKYPAAYNRYARIGEKIPAYEKKKWLGNWVRRSEDQGKTWLEPARTTVTAPHGPISLKNGNLLYVGTVPDNGTNKVMAEMSYDDGKSWKVLAELPRNPDYTVGLSEPHVVELKSGKLIAMIRHEPKNQNEAYLLQSESTDGGKTWTQMEKTAILGYPPHLIQLKNGWLLVVYGFRNEPFSEKACISKDEGKTWDVSNEIILSNAPSRDLGYPSSIQLDDESIITVFYQAPQVGQPTVLKSTHWKLKS